MGKQPFPKKPGFLYGFAATLVKAFVKIFWDVDVKRTVGGLKPPYVVIANHQSNIDFILSTTSMFPEKMNYVVGKYLFRSPLSSAVFRLLGAIPKEQFYPDVAAIMEMRRVIERGGILAIFPAGQSSYTGGGTVVPEGIGKLIKRLGVPVVNLHIDGAHLAYPKWNMKRVFKTKMSVTISPLLCAKEIADLSACEIFERVANAVAFNDYDCPLGSAAAQKPRLAKGLEYVLYQCPKCGGEFCMKTEANSLACTRCGNEALLDARGFLRAADEKSVAFKTPVEWSAWQSSRLAQRLEEIEGFVLSHSATCAVLGKRGKFRETAAGTVTLTNDTLLFAGSQKDGTVFALCIPIAHYPTFQHETLTGFDLKHGDQIYRFAPQETGAAFKFVAFRQLCHARQAGAEAKRHAAAE